MPIWAAGEQTAGTRAFTTHVPFDISPDENPDTKQPTAITEFTPRMMLIIDKIGPRAKMQSCRIDGSAIYRTKSPLHFNSAPSKKSLDDQVQFLDQALHTAALKGHPSIFDSDKEMAMGNSD